MLKTRWCLGWGLEEWGSPKQRKGQVDLEQKEKKEPQGWEQAQRYERDTEKWRVWRSQRAGGWRVCWCGAVRAGSLDSIWTPVGSQKRNRGREDRADLCRRRNKGSDENKLEMRKPIRLGAQLGGRLGLVIKPAPGFTGPVTVMVPQLSLSIRGSFLPVLRVMLDDSRGPFHGIPQNPERSGS